MSRETKISPMLCNYMNDAVSCYPHEADWFRVEFKGKWLGDYRSLQEANAALALACEDAMRQ